MRPTDSLTQPGLMKPLLLAVLLGLVAACNDDTQQSSSESAQPAETTATEPADSEADTDSAPAEAVSETQTRSTDSEMSADDSSDADASTESGASGGENYTVKARSTSFDPVVVQINPGDSVNWTNMGGHNVNFEEGNIPAEAEPWQTPLGKNVDRTFDHEGLYLYKCDPHFSLGMVGAIIVGEPDNVAQVEENAKGMYKRALAKATAQID